MCPLSLTLFFQWTIMLSKELYVTCKSEHSSAIHELLLLVTGRRWSSKRCRRSAANCTATARRTTSSHTRWTSRCIGRCACSFSLSSSSLQLYYTVRFSLVCASTSAPVHVPCQFCLAAPPSNSWRTAVGSPPACRPRKLTHSTAQQFAEWRVRHSECASEGIALLAVSSYLSSLECAARRSLPSPSPALGPAPSIPSRRSAVDRRFGPARPPLCSHLDSIQLDSVLERVSFVSTPCLLSHLLPALSPSAIASCASIDSRLVFQVGPETSWAFSSSALFSRSASIFSFRL